MAEYIEKAQIVDWYRCYGQTDEPIPFETLVVDLRSMKSADVAPVVHGRWVGSADDFCCSACGVYQNFYTGRQNYCPNCGARMDGET